MNLHEIDETFFAEESVGRSAFLLLGVGPEPDAQELATSIAEIVGASITNELPVEPNSVPGEDSVLSLVVNEDTLPLHMWVTDINDTVSEAVRMDSQADDDAIDMALNSDWALFVISELRSESLLEDLSCQLQCVDLLCTEVVRQVGDLSAQRLWSVQDFRDLIAIPGCPPISDLYALRTVTPEQFLGTPEQFLGTPEQFLRTSAVLPEAKAEATAAKHDPPQEENALKGRGLWAHTRGLERFGLPNIEAFDVPAEHLHQFRELMDSLVERLVDTPELLANIFNMGDNARGALIDIEEVISGLPSGAAGADPKLRNLDPSLYGERLVLLGVYRDKDDREEHTHWDLTPILENLRRTGKLYRSTHNAARMQKLTRYRLPLLKSVWSAHHGHDWRLLVKIPFVGTSNEQREHRWFEIEDLDSVEIQGWPIGQAESPAPTANPCSIELNELSAFMLVTPEGKWDAARLPELARILAG